MAEITQIPGAKRPPGKIVKIRLVTAVGSFVCEHDLNTHAAALEAIEVQGYLDVIDARGEKARFYRHAILVCGMPRDVGTASILTPN